MLQLTLSENKLVTNQEFSKPIINTYAPKWKEKNTLLLFKLYIFVVRTNQKQRNQLIVTNEFSHFVWIVSFPFPWPS